MSIVGVRKCVFILCLAFLSVVALTDDAEAAATPDKGVFSTLKESYDDLPPKGKLATGVAVGFFGSRLTVKAATNVIKVAGVTFIVSEVANYAGVFDKISEENNERLQKVKQSVANNVNDFRVNMRRQLKPETWRGNLEAAFSKEKMATIGVATGAFVGFAL